MYHATRFISTDHTIIIKIKLIQQSQNKLFNLKRETNDIKTFIYFYILFCSLVVFI